MYNDKIVISNMYRAKNKQSFFAIHQIVSKIKAYKPNCQIDFHILWDNKIELQPDDINWESKINDFVIKNNIKLYEYDRTFFKNYLSFFGISSEKLDNFTGIYFILMAHYLRRVKLENYYLIYDDDILINYDFCDIIDLMLEQIPVLIVEPMNSNCDKVMTNSILSLFGEDFVNIYKNRNPNMLGFNAGFQGIDLSLYDHFLNTYGMAVLFSGFDFSGIHDENGNERMDAKRFLLDTQQQSFFSTMNIIASKQNPHILDPNEYFIIPNWGTHPVFGEINTSDENDGWTYALKSKITHFIGHTQGKGKPKIFLNKIDEYLKENNLI
jgi:hypothetical protein